MTKIAVFPGTFDPITLGHQDLIARAAKMFEKVIVAVAENPSKSPLFTLATRLELISNSLSMLKNVQVKGFNNLLVDFARAQGATVIVRGVRVINDFEHELQLVNMNRSLAPELEAVFLIPTEKYSFISSTMVKEVASLGGDIRAFVNGDVATALQSAKWL